MKIDLKYLCTVIGNLSGIPIRLYKKNKLVFFHSLVKLPKDPICLCVDELLNKKTNVHYYVSPFSHYYGVVNNNANTIIIGPTSQLTNDEQQLRELAFRCHVQQIDVDDFVIAMKNIVTMPLDSIIQILFTLNHVLNGEKLNLKDLRILDSQTAALQASPNICYDDALPSEQTDQSNNSYALEQTLLNIVEHGDSASLQQWATNAPAVKSGIIAHEQLRQIKNTFIVTTTLICRSAIRGGMDVHEALSLSDAYIQKCELLADNNAIINLQYQMIVHYTQKVERIRRGKNPSKLTVDVTNYVLHHISEPIKTEDIAKALFISRSRLSTKFKQETGITLTDYILKEKAVEATRLLRYTTNPIASISEFLGFSSQSHFNRVFKKYVGVSPKEYRLIKQ